MMLVGSDRVLHGRCRANGVRHLDGSQQWFRMKEVFNFSD